jgi:hypothetical protein
MNIQEIIQNTQRSCLETSNVVEVSQDIIFQIKANPLRTADYADNAILSLRLTCTNNAILLNLAIRQLQSAIVRFPEHSDMLNILAAEAHAVLLRNKRLIRLIEKHSAIRVVN